MPGFTCLLSIHTWAIHSRFHKPRILRYFKDPCQKIFENYQVFSHIFTGSKNHHSSIAPGFASASGQSFPVMQLRCENMGCVQTSHLLLLLSSGDFIMGNPHKNMVQNRAKHNRTSMNQHRNNTKNIHDISGNWIPPPFHVSLETNHNHTNIQQCRSLIYLFNPT